MYLVSPTGEEKEKQSMKRKKKNKKCQGDLAEARGLSRGHSRAPVTTTLHVDDPPGSPSTFVVSLN